VFGAGNTVARLQNVSNVSKENKRAVQQAENAQPNKAARDRKKKGIERRAFRCACFDYGGISGDTDHRGTDAAYEFTDGTDVQPHTH